MPIKNFVFCLKNNTKSLGRQVDKKMTFAKGCLKSGKSSNKIPKNLVECSESSFFGDFVGK